MSKRTISTISATAIGCLGLGRLRRDGLRQRPGPHSHSHRSRPHRRGPGGGRLGARRRLGRPQAVQARRAQEAEEPEDHEPDHHQPGRGCRRGTEVVAKLTCPRNKGIPLSGGAISPPAPADVAISVISRFNPNPPYEAEANNYYVGVRNSGGTPEDFRGTLVCAKGIDERG